MASQDYLIAIALIEQNLIRAMPLGGKEVKDNLENPENLKCFRDIIAKSAEDKISVKAALEISPSYLLKSKNKKVASKIRIVADACFR